MPPRVWSLSPFACIVRLLVLLFSTGINTVDAALVSSAKQAKVSFMPPRSSPSSTRLLRRFFILRHGETDANASGMIQGSSDVSRLTERGKVQAAQVGAQVFGEANPNAFSMPPIDSIYVSPLTRATDTLNIVRNHAANGRLPPTETTLHELREIDLYSWEGRNIKDIQMTDAASFEAWKTGDAEAIVVDGDKFPIIETWRRAEAVWKTIREREQEKKQSMQSGDAVVDSERVKEHSTLLVCHGTLGQALLCAALGLDETNFRRFEFPNCGLVEILWKDDKEVATSFKWHYPKRTERLHPPVDTTLA